MVHRGWMLAVCGLLATIAAGCDSDVRAEAPRPLTAAERSVLDRAEAQLTADCMRRLGFPYVVVAPAAATPDFPYGIDDPAFAAAYGFGVAHAQEAIDAARAKDPNYRYVRGLAADRQAAFEAALDGNRRDPVAVSLPNGRSLNQSSRGCTAEAQSQLYGDFAGWVRSRTLVEALPDGYLPGVADDPGYRATLAAWAGCMADRGYAVSDPAGLRERVPPATRGRPGRAELRAAVAEAECATRTGLVRSARAVERVLADRASTESREVIEEYQRLSVHALGVAQQIAGAGR